MYNVIILKANASTFDVFMQNFHFVTWNKEFLPIKCERDEDLLAK